MSSETITDYKIVVGEDSYILEHNVKELLEKGWALKGFPFSHWTKMYQAMVKPDYTYSSKLPLG